MANLALFGRMVLANDPKAFELLFELLEVGGELGPKVSTVTA